MSPLQRVPAPVLDALARGTQGRVWSSLRAAWLAARIAAAHASRERAWRLLRTWHHAYRRAIARALRGVR